ncbi:hypothetical protein GALMADRAFT_628349 [Galerina marginata CBS 339.88]|uniref:Uncharacterized protein n=1 Tax=Galerina marginata (strain CBS 339.88) TaxID=685588 RepID=A0A067SRW9_GALM3|nr:hypothetical protein GALMADRAFT_628349 [Galerina marginata CBS 339.88]
MSLDPEAVDEQLGQSHERATLRLEIPSSSSEPSSSAPSSGPPSPNPLADSDTLTPHNTSSETPPSSTSTHSTSTHTSASSLPSTTLSVKFAPLPDLGPRRRRSNTPLGMAARGQLMRRRKGHYNAQQNQQQLEQQQMVNSAWTPEEFEAHRLKQEELAARYAHYQANATALVAREEEAQLEVEEEEMERLHMQKAEKARAAEEEEDPFLVLGKTVKTFWRKVAHKDSDIEGAEVKPKEKDRHKEKAKGKEDSITLKRRKSDVGQSPRTSTPPPLPPPPMRPILANITPSNFQEALEPFEPPEPTEVGGVWEEEIGDAFPRNVSQTETIVEGRPMYSLAKAEVTTTAKVEALAKPVPTNKADPAHRLSVLVKSHKNPPVKSKSLVASKS